MLQVPRWRIIAVVLAAVLGLVFAAPTVLPKNLRDQLPSFLRDTTINLGLDLRGGTQLLMQIDTQAMLRQRLENVADEMRVALRDAEPRIRTTGAGVVGGVARIRLADPNQAQAAMRVLQGIVQPIQVNAFGGGEPDKEFTLRDGGVIEGRVTEVALSQLARQAVSQSIEVIRRRIDPSGIGETSIAPEGAERIVIQAPGETDPEALRRRVGRTALMTFHLLREDANVEEAAQGRVPAGAIYAPFAESAGGSGGLVLERRPRLTGRNLTDANATFDDNGRPAVGFQFDGSGARIFCRLSTANVGKPFAIVLDDRIITAPTIQGPICGNNGIITGQFTPQETQELALLLRAGALPVPLTILQQNTVTAELGKDAIDSGQTSTVIALALVLVFMVFAYGLLFGGISVIALVLNGVLIIATMAIAGAALTLPGVAGLILTLAVAVDANVLIYERMRDEVRAGRSPVLAAESGFSRAMVTIIDANLTTLGAAVILFVLGAGPIKGFAWTLTIGVFTSVFTAVFVTQILIAWWFRAARPKKLPI